MFYTLDRQMKKKQKRQLQKQINEMNIIDNLDGTNDPPFLNDSQQQ